MTGVLRFACTQCGRCCHDHNLPLSIDEAIDWVATGGTLDLYCEATPWPEAAPPEPELAAHVAGRSLAAACGSRQVRVAVVLAGVNRGACRHLLPDMRCGIYETRPLVCRIYPLETRPQRPVEPTAKACPTEAWQGPALIDDAARALIAEARRRDAAEAPRRQALCRLLGISVAALAGHGFVIHKPDGRILPAALRAVRDMPPEPADDAWRIYAPSPAAAEDLAARGYDAIAAKPWGAPFWLAPVASGP